MEHVRSGTVVHSPEGARKKAEGKKRPSPQTPYREKGKGKEIRPPVYETGLSRAYAGVKRGGAGSRAYTWRAVNAAVDEAVAAFGGKPSDRAIWAGIAWRVGYGYFLDCVHQARSEIRAKTRRPAAADLPRIFQNALNERFPKGGAK